MDNPSNIIAPIECGPCTERRKGFCQDQLSSDEVAGATENEQQASLQQYMTTFCGSETGNRYMIRSESS